MGSWTSPLAIMTFWRWPAESSENGRKARSSIPSFSRIEWAAFRSSLAEPILLYGWRPMITMSITLSGKLDAEEYGTYPMILANSLRLYSDASFPSIRTFPLEGVSRRFRQCRNVDFPTPLGPIMETTSPSLKLRDTDSRTLLSL